MPDLFGLAVNGPIARTVADAALLLDVMSGNQPGDMYTLPPLPAGETFLGYAARPPGRLRIGRTLQHPIEGAAVHPDCVAAYEDASALLASLGHEVEDVAMPFGPDAVPAFETVWYAHGHAGPGRSGPRGPAAAVHRVHARPRPADPGQRPGLRPGLSPVMVRQALAVLNGYDALLTPTLASPPVPVGYFEEVAGRRTSSGRSASPRSPPLYNVSGQPAVNLPLHWNADGLPIGVMLAGRMGEEGTLISLSAHRSCTSDTTRTPSVWMR